MKKGLGVVASLVVACALTAVPARAQIRLEITGCGGFGFNLASASSIAADAAFVSGTSTYPEAWRPFFRDPVLEMGAGPDFGARFALWFGLIGFEGSFESSLAKPRFHAASADGLEAYLQSIGGASDFTIVRDGGQMMRFSGNIIFYVLPSEVVRPYLTAGIGSTSTTIKPSVHLHRPAAEEEIDLRYAGVSALTLNAGGGLSLWFTPVIGLRIETRFYYGIPTFRQTYFHKIAGTVQWHTDSYVTQSGPQIDAGVSVGLVIRVL